MTYAGCDVIHVQPPGSPLPCLTFRPRRFATCRAPGTLTTAQALAGFSAIRAKLVAVRCSACRHLPNCLCLCAPLCAPDISAPPPSPSARARLPWWLLDSPLQCRSPAQDPPKPTEEEEALVALAAEVATCAADPDAVDVIEDELDEELLTKLQVHACIEEQTHTRARARTPCQRRSWGRHHSTPCLRNC
jgi:hypothetical protein